MWRGAALALAAASVAAAMPADDSLISDLPGRPATNFSEWSGYIAVNGSADGLFYWMQDAQAPSDDLVFWFTGGPGCSSLLALMTENGAYRPRSDGSGLDLNPYAWNHLATVVFVESPVGVGFSARQGVNYTSGDDAAATDALAFVLGLLDRYTFLQSKRVYISGESYAGHYVPQLVDRILRHNADRPSQAVKLHGLLVGNPSTDFSFDGGRFYFQFMKAHGMVGQQLYDAALARCNGSFQRPYTPDCQAAVDDITQNFEHINPYNVYAPCVVGKPSTGGCFTAAAAASLLAHELSPAALRAGRRAPFLPAASAALSLAQTYVPCIDFSPVVTYFNRPDVRAALHVRADAPEWDVCSQHLAYTQYAPSVLPLYRSFLGRPLRLAVFSGDTDSCVPFPGTEAALDSLGLPLHAPWQPWFVGGQVAGYSKAYATQSPDSSFQFITVHDAGHMVPTYQPERALAMLQAFLSGTALPGRAQ